MMKRLFLGLAIHNHQPGDNFSYVFEKAYRQSYLPLVEALERHPNVYISLHYSGCLLDWLIENHPEFIDRVDALVKRGQVEMMTGGYYEPIIPIIPDSDKLGQIQKLSSYIHKRFDFSPTGLWLADRVWEPQLPKVLSQASIEWTVVDDNHFKMVGLSDEERMGYYVTEDEGHTIKVFSSSKKLRYLIPWRNVEEVIEHLISMATEDGDRIVMMGDDGEKFGLWPDTYKLCWQDGWMERFFKALEDNSDWLSTTHIKEYAEHHAPLGIIYLPTASYAEMQEWSLPASVSHEYAQTLKRLEAENQDDIAKFVHAGFWRSFLAKYPEINTMHKKMLRVHGKVYRARKITTDDAGLDELWRGQCNCPYWHGIFGGIYSAHIRHGTYRHLIAAENSADSTLYNNKPFITHKVTDFDSDTQKELLIESDCQNIYIDPHDGGSIFEWDLRRLGHNLCAVMTRRHEGYHQDIIESERIRREGLEHSDEQDVKSIHEIVRAKQEDLDRLLFYDRRRRSSLVDRFLLKDATADEMLRGNYEDVSDFADRPYSCSVKKQRGRVAAHLARAGHIGQGDELLPVHIDKLISARAESEALFIKYRLTNTSESVINGIFTSEWNLAITDDSHSNHCFYRLFNEGDERMHSSKVYETSEVGSVYIRDPDIGLDISLSINKPARLWRYPIEAVTNSEDGFELTYQGSCFIIGWDVYLEPGESWEAVMKWQQSP